MHSDLVDSYENHPMLKTLAENPRDEVAFLAWKKFLMVCWETVISKFGNDTDTGIARCKVPSRHVRT